MRWPRLMVFLTLVLLSACTTTNEPVSNRGGGKGYILTIWASAHCVNSGDTLVVRGTVTNAGSTTKIIELEGQPVFDVYIGSNEFPKDGTIRWSDGKPLTLDLTHLELKPGETKSLEFKWVVIERPPSAIGVVANLIDNPKDMDHPIAVSTTVYTSSGCVGIGP